MQLHAVVRRLSDNIELKPEDFHDLDIPIWREWAEKIAQLQAEMRALLDDWNKSNVTEAVFCAIGETHTDAFRCLMTREYL